MKARYLFILAVGFAVVSIIGLRANAQRSLELKDQIVQKDLAGQKVTEDIKELREFVFAHMNASAEFELAGSYERDVVLAQQGGVTETLYRKAQTACDREGDSSVVQAQCVQRYLADRIDANVSPKLPLRSRYVYAFASPAWRPDLAGLALLTAIGLMIAAIVIYIAGQFKTRRVG